MMSLSGLISYLSKIESELTTLAQQVSSGVSWDEVFRKIEKVRGLIDDALAECESILESSTAEPDDRKFALVANRVLNSAKKLVDSLTAQFQRCRSRGLDPRSCTIDYSPLFRFENTFVTLLDRGCVSARSSTMSSALTDFAACVRTLREESYRRLEWTRHDLCNVSGNASSVASKLCMLWSRALREAEKLGVTSVKRQHVGFAFDGKVMIRADDISDTDVVVDLDRGTVTVYTNSDNVRDVVIERLEKDVGLTCEKPSRPGGRVVCYNLRKSDEKQLARLALAIAEISDMVSRVAEWENLAKATIIAKNFDRIVV